MSGVQSVRFIKAFRDAKKVSFKRVNGDQLEVEGSSANRCKTKFGAFYDQPYILKRFETLLGIYGAYNRFSGEIESLGFLVWQPPGQEMPKKLNENLGKPIAYVPKAQVADAKNPEDEEYDDEDEEDEEEKEAQSQHSSSSNGKAAIKDSWN